MTKAKVQRNVEFFAASSRLAKAYRNAAKRNKVLTRHATMHEMRRGRSAVKLGKEISAVLLSHADDDHLVLTDERLEPVIAGAFHLLFTEPATHPDQVAQWMRKTKIRSENRLHVVKVDDLEAPQVSQLLGRICFALGRDGSRGSIIDAYIVGDR